MIANRCRRLGQGMTEYIILVGLIAVLLTVAVTRFKNQIQYTIEGTTGEVEDLDIGGDGPPPPGGDDPDGPTGSYEPTGRMTADNEEIYSNNGVDYVKRNGTYVPVR